MRAKKGIRGGKRHVLSDEANRRGARYGQLMMLEYKTSGEWKGRAMPQLAYLAFTGVVLR
jgi:hypothetical protein